MRSAVAEQHGLDEALVDQVRRPRGTDDSPASEAATERVELSAAQQAAVDFADAVISSPADMSDDVVRRLRAHWSPAQIVELALDIMKWSYQKIPVALGSDAEVVPGAVTPLVFDADGRWVRPG